jgi:uncharacterized protein
VYGVGQLFARPIGWVSSLRLTPSWAERIGAPPRGYGSTIGVARRPVAAHWRAGISCQQLHETGVLRHRSIVGELVEKEPGSIGERADHREGCFVEHTSDHTMSVGSGAAGPASSWRDQATGSPDPRAASGPERVFGPFGLLVAQPETLCNLDCTYCYLLDRDRQRLMSDQVAQAIADGIADQDAPDACTVCWHAGEPLATGLARFERLLAPFEALRAEGRVVHSLQTNATLITEQWCALFTRYGIRVGVSVDGPAHLNANRRDWHGRPTFGRTMRGIARLKAHGLPFDVISVVSTETIGRAGELLAFLEELAPGSVGFNIEERELANKSRALVTRDQAEAFWHEVITHLRGGSTLRVREIAELADYLRRKRAGHTWERRRDPVPTVSFSGDVVLLSPELGGARPPEHRDFVVGNVLRTPLRDIMARMSSVGYVREFAQGVANCRASCSAFDFCRGAFASNRYFELGDFTATETAFCVNSRQAVVSAVLGDVRADPVSGSTEILARLLEQLAAHPG